MTEVWLPLLIAAVSGGTIVKILDWLLKIPLTRQKLAHAEQDRLVAEVARLTVVVKKLRFEVDQLRDNEDKVLKNLHNLKAKWYALRSVVLAIAAHVEYHGADTTLDSNEELTNLLDDAVDIAETPTDEEVGQEHKTKETQRRENKRES